MGNEEIKKKTEEDLGVTIADKLLKKSTWILFQEIPIYFSEI